LAVVVLTVTNWRYSIAVALAGPDPRRINEFVLGLSPTYSH